MQLSTLTDDMFELVDTLRAELSKSVIGQSQVLNQLLISLLANGHVLLEGVPGVGKTLLAKSLSASFSGEYSRIQFTPDLLPGDLIGTNLFNFQKYDISIACIC